MAEMTHAMEGWMCVCLWVVMAEWTSVSAWVTGRSV